MTTSVKLAKTVPDPPTITPEGWEKIRVEGEEWHQSFARTKQMEYWVNVVLH